MILYSGPMSMFGAKAQIAVAEKGLRAELVMVPFGLRRRYDPKHPEVLRINPKGQVPVLVDGVIEISDSTQIFEYLEAAYPHPPLWPTGAVERTIARQFEHAADEVFFPNVVRLMDADVHSAVREGALGDIEYFRRDVDRRLERADYVCGEFSYADIAFFMADLFAVVLGAGPREDARHLRAWRRRMAARPAVASIVMPMVRYITDRNMPRPDHIPLPPDLVVQKPAADGGERPAQVAPKPADIAGAS